MTPAPEGGAGRVAVHWAVAERPLTDEGVRSAAAAALGHGGRPDIELDVVLVDDATLCELHERYLGDPSPTDVLSFDLSEEHGGAAGELYVSVDCARSTAAQRGGAAARELALYVVHGVLHLCGYDDVEPADRSRMRDAEAVVLTSLGYPPDCRPHDLDPA